MRDCGKLLPTAFLLLAFTASIPAQDKPLDDLPRFEVASIKPVDPKIMNNMGIRISPGGRLFISGLSVKALIGTAFQLAWFQMSGGDEWIAKDEYVIEATPPANLRASIKDLRHTLFTIEDARLREMLQALLIDRFQLKFHRETKPGDVYLLEKNGKPLVLRPTDTSAPDGDIKSFGSIGYAGGRWVLAATSMPQLASFASRYIVRAPVHDRTDLTGAFDYRQGEADLDPNYSDNTDSFLRLLPQLGLKMQRTRGTVEFFVVDHAAKPLPN